MRTWGSKLAARFGRDRLDAELRAEMDAHLQMDVEDRIGRGASRIETMNSNPPRSTVRR